MSIYLGNKKVSPALKIKNSILLDIIQGTATDIKASDWQGITKINDYLFYHNRNLKSIEIPDSVTEIGIEVFTDCQNLKYVKFPSSIEKINRSAFYYPGTHKFLPDFRELINLKYVGSNAFYHNQLIGDIILPDSVEYIGDSAFSPYRVDSMTSFTVSSNILDISKACINNNISTSSRFFQQYKNGYYLGSTTNPYLVYMRPIDSTQQEYEIHKDCKVIAQDAFNNNKNITNLVPEDGCELKAVGYHAFNKSSLKSFNFNTIEYIGPYSFTDCTSLESFTIPNSFRPKFFQYNYPAYYFLGGCSNLIELNFDASQWPNGRYPNDDNWWFSQAGLNADGIILNIGNNVTRIPTRFTYSNNSSSWRPKIKIINFGDKVEAIGAYAFTENSYIEELVIPKSVKIIESGAFNRNTALKKLTINAEELSDYAFAYCNNLSELKLNEGLKYIKSVAFWFNTSLQSVELPSSILSLSNQVFEGCTSLTTLSIKALNPPTIQVRTFTDAPLTTIYIPTGTLEAYSTATNWSNFADKFIEKDF